MKVKRIPCVIDQENSFDAQQVFRFPNEIKIATEKFLYLCGNKSMAIGKNAFSTKIYFDDFYFWDWRNNCHERSICDARMANHFHKNVCIPLALEHKRQRENQSEKHLKSYRTSFIALTRICTAL